MNDVAALISSVGTVIATAVSLYLLRQGQRDRRSLRDEQNRSQARQVTIWTDWNADSSERDFDQPHVPAISVANGSHEAVYEVFVDYRDQTDGTPVRIDFGAVPPGQIRSRDVPTPAARDPRWEPSSLLPRLFFRDAEGRGWMRDAMGRLRQDPGPGNDGFFEAGGRLALGILRPQPSPLEYQSPERRAGGGG